MYQAIVFLPLLGAILAGLIALAGARARFPGKGPSPGAEDSAADHGAHGGAVIRSSHHEEETHEPAAAGSRTAELITTTLLMISMILSWIAFVEVGFAHHDMRDTGIHMDDRRRSESRMVAAYRHAHCGDAGGGEHGVGLRASLFHRIHARGSVPATLLRLSVDFYLRHADAGDGRQSGAVVLRLGRRRPCELPPDRLLVSQAGSERRRDQGLHRKPRRRFRFCARYFRGVHAHRRNRF